MTDQSLNLTPTHKLNGIKLALPAKLEGTRVADKLADGKYEHAEAAAILKRAAPGMKILEVGAGLGYITSLCARVAGPEHVVSLEANPEMIEVAQTNLALNNLQGVTLLHGALTPKQSDADEVRFHAGGAFWGGAVVEDGVENGAAVTVPAIGLDELLDSWQPQLVMMDIEGAEQYLFDNPWPDCVRHVMLELHLQKYTMRKVKKIVDCMSASGLTYDPFASTGRLVSFIRIGRYK